MFRTSLQIIAVIALGALISAGLAESSAGTTGVQSAVPVA